MANAVTVGQRTDLEHAARVVRSYVAVVIATLVTLVVMAVVAPALATGEAWGHAVIVAAFAVLLPWRLGAARRGSPRALRAVTVIAAVLAVVNLVEAALPAFSTWMRWEMVVIAVLMAVLGVLTLRARA